MVQWLLNLPHILLTWKPEFLVAVEFLLPAAILFPEYFRSQVMSIANGKSLPTCLYNLCGHALSSLQIAKYLGITLTDELSWSSGVHWIHLGLLEEEPSALSCQTLKRLR